MSTPKRTHRTRRESSKLDALAFTDAMRDILRSDRKLPPYIEVERDEDLAVAG